MLDQSAIHINDYKEVKTFAGLCNLISGLPIYNLSEVKYKQFFHVFIGDHDSDMFLQIDILNGSFQVTERMFNGKNYDLIREATVYVRRTGDRKLVRMLADLILN